MIQAEDLEPGRSYACKYIDLAGETCLAVIVRRDTEKRLLELEDVDTGTRMVLGYDSVHDIDTVEWQ